jgi:hypothetical protein
MNLSHEAKGWKEEQLAQGRAIARGMTEENARKEKSKAGAEKRKETTLRNAAQKMFNRTYSE